MARVFVLNGHPHADSAHYCHALATAYEMGARKAGHAVHRMELATIAPQMLTNPADFGTDPVEPVTLAAREAVSAAEHIVVVFPLWLGTLPAALKAFFEQLARGGFAIGPDPKGGWPVQHLAG